MVLRYAEGGSFNNWAKVSNNGYYHDMTILHNIIRGLGKLHEKKIVHRDFIQEIYYLSVMVMVH